MIVLFSDRLLSVTQHVQWVACSLQDVYKHSNKGTIRSKKYKTLFFLAGANQTFYSAAKNAKFSVFKTCKMAVAGQNTRRPPARPENYCESKQTYFSYSLDKAFHSPEFQAKLFFTRNWVGGFYWDSLLKYLLLLTRLSMDLLLLISNIFKATSGHGILGLSKKIYLPYLLLTRTVMALSLLLRRFFGTVFLSI